MYIKHPKDILDIEALKDKIDVNKIAEMKKNVDSILESAIEATEVFDKKGKKRRL